ncbi:MAG: hypothetical protein IT439_01000 [Phycisphaerales bacterium]|nr:hypothetical protein [Phycisphaerales bacterium]
MLIHRSAARAAIVLAALAGGANAQLRVATWNISFYGGGRGSDIRTAVYGVFEGRSLAPDVLLGQEFLSQAAVNDFLLLLNSAPGSPGDWAAASFVDGPDTDSAFFYRTSRVVFVAQSIISAGGSPPAPPRHTMRYDMRLAGYTGEGATVSLYSVHLKAGTGGDDSARRLVECQRIRDDALTLPAGRSFIIGGDFNIRTSSEAAYQALLQVFNDPIHSPGSWNQNSAFRFLHTQDPVGSGGMDDRHDQLLLSDSLVDADAFEYVGDPATAYSTITWNDPNHSYRAWGNDGTTFDQAMRITGNTMVGAAIAQAVVNCANGAGHLPVVLDCFVPPKAQADLVLDFGSVSVGDLASLDLNVLNSANDALWTAPGIADLSYSFSAPSGFAAPGGLFFESAGGGANTHAITMDTSSPGVRSGTLIITTNAPESPTILVSLTGEVVDDSCPADLSGSADPNDPAYGVPDGAADSSDFFYFLDQFAAGNLAVADLSGSADPNDPAYGVPDGAVDAADFFYFLDIFTVGC